MHPEKHRDELAHLARKDRFFGLAAFLSTFLFSYYILSPFLHEAGHVSVLVLSGCGYSLDAGFNLFTGVTGSVDPLCRLEKLEAVLFQLSGYLTVVSAGLIGFYRSMKEKNGTPADFYGGFAIGAIVSTVSTVRTRGDIHRTTELLGIENLAPALEAGAVIVLMVATLYFLEKIFQKGRKGAETSP